MAVVGGSDEWTAKAYSAIGACAVIVAGGILLLGRLDKAWMERRKRWEDFDKDSLHAKLAETNESLAKMRASLHEANNLSQTALNENTSLHDDLGILRGQFMDVARSLGSVQTRLVECEDDRIELHRKLIESMQDRSNLHALVLHLQTTANANEKRLDAIEDSGENRLQFPDHKDGSPC